ncbi:hypothetical protein [Streptomyces goshikiensis]|uniref:hypothetical protein n=1 Tax=Streptomyces goshikiensis TaxID=1942 RepID=UPI00368B92E7
MFDMLQHVDWHIVAANVGKKSDLPKPPKPYPRWWLKNTKADKQGADRVARLEAARARKRDREGAIAAGLIT